MLRGPLETLMDSSKGNQQMVTTRTSSMDHSSELRIPIFNETSASQLASPTGDCSSIPPPPGGRAQIPDVNPLHPRLPDGEVINQQQPSPTSGGVDLDNKTQDNNVDATLAAPGRKPGRSRRNRLRPHERYAENQKILENIFKKKHFIKFFTAKAISGENLADTNTIQANRQLCAVLGGPPKRITELRSGSLLVEVKDEEQSKNIQNLKQLNNIPITVEEHPTLNTIQGTIYYKNRPNHSDADILTELADQQVTKVYRVKRRRNGVDEYTGVYILTFKLCALPPDVHIGWTQCSVREYIPNPRRCYNCQKFGHGSDACRLRNNTGTCFRCGEVAHGPNCDRPAKCANCSEDHPASSRDCFYYKLEKEIISIQTRERLSYPEAKRQVTDKFIRPLASFAAVTAGMPLTRALSNVQHDAPPPLRGRGNGRRQSSTMPGTMEIRSDISSLIPTSPRPSLADRRAIGVPDLELDDDLPSLETLSRGETLLPQRNHQQPRKMDARDRSPANKPTLLQAQPRGPLVAGQSSQVTPQPKCISGTPIRAPNIPQSLPRSATPTCNPKGTALNTSLSDSHPTPSSSQTGDPRLPLTSAKRSGSDLYDDDPTGKDPALNHDHKRSSSNTRQARPTGRE